MNDPDGQGPGDAQPTPEPESRPEIDIDTAFAAIVADFAKPVPREGPGPWPASEDLADDDAGAADPEHGSSPDDAGNRTGAPTSRRDSPRRRIVLPDGEAPGEPTATEESDRRLADEDTHDDEGYHPPDPPPLPKGDVISRLAWGAVIGGPLFLLVAALTWRSLPSLLLLLALVAFVGGFVTLVARMPQEHPDDPDDGAVV